MIGPTGVGKTEIARRLAKLAGAPFIKVEATKFHRGRLCRPRLSSRSFAIWSKSRSRRTRERKRKDVQARAQLAAEDRVLDAVVGANSSAATRDSFPHEIARRRPQRQGNRDRDAVFRRYADVLKYRACPARRWGAISIGDIFGKMGGRTKTRRLTVADSHELLVNEGNPTSCWITSSWCRNRSTRSRITASCFSTTSRQDLRPRWPQRRRTSRAKACSAICCR